MTEADITRERTLAYAAGYEAGKADAAKEACVVLTEEERDLLSYVLADPCQTSWLSHADNETLRNLLARDAAAKAAAADGVVVRREVLEVFTGAIDPMREDFEAIHANAIAEAEAALKGGE